MKLRVWNSLAYRLLITLALFSLLLVGGIAFVNTKIVEKSYLQQQEQTVDALLVPWLPKLEKSTWLENQKALEEQLASIVAMDTINSAEVFNADSKFYVAAGDVNRRHLLIVRKDLMYKDSKLATAVFGVSDADFKTMMKQYFQYLGAVAAGYLILVFFLMRLVYRAFMPLQDLTRQLEGFDPGNPVPIKLARGGKNEIGMIAEAANKMSGNIAHHAEYLRELNTRIEEGQMHLKEAQQIARMGSWRVNTQSYACEFSDQIYALLSIDKDDKTLQWKEFLQAVEPGDRRFLERAIENTVQTHTPFRLMHKMRNRHGELMHVLTEGKLSSTVPGSRCVTAISMDVTEQTENQRMIEKLAFYDALTGLPNRLLFNDRLAKAIKDAKRRSEKVGVLFLDLDRFKNVNDTLGHSLGDILLKEVAARLRRDLRETDTVCRIGGDEFIVIAPMLKSEEDAKIVAKKLLTAMQERWELGEKSLFTTTSVGVALYPDHASDVDTLVKYADTAMYKAKEEGRNKIKLYNDSMGEKLRQALKIEQEMRAAIVSMEQFELYYQPKISLRNGAIVGAEVLIRWNHPDLGLVFPDEFIPIAENTGMIIRIGEWVMHEAARQVEQWKKEGVAPLRLAVNLSGRQFQSPQLLFQIRTVLNAYDIRPQYLEFEVTESISMISLHESLKVLHQLKDIGVGVSIDDFGTGYSSLAYLKQFPVDTLKIDKAFIMNMLEDDDDRIIVESIASLSKAMNLKVVAEGVETIEHVRALKKMGVDFGQGYYFSKPIPLSQFDPIYRNNLIRMKERRDAQQRKAEQT